MKKNFIVLAVLSLELNVFAQYDEQFYYPKKEWISSDFPAHEDISLPINPFEIPELFFQ